MRKRRPVGDRRHFGRLLPGLLACLVGGCADSASTATPGSAPNPSATASPADPVGTDPAAPAIVAGKSDRDAVLAALKEQGIDVVAPGDVQVRSFRYTGLKDPVEWFVEVEQKPSDAGQEGLLRLTLPPDPRELGDGTLDLVLLPPKSTGREGLRIVLRSHPDGGGGRLVSLDAPALWFGWPKRTLRVQSRLDGGLLNPKPPRTYKLIAYSAGEEGTSKEASISLRCRTPKP